VPPLPPPPDVRLPGTTVPVGYIGDGLREGFWGDGVAVLSSDGVGVPGKVGDSVGVTSHAAGVGVPGKVGESVGVTSPAAGVGVPGNVGDRVGVTSHTEGDGVPGNVGESVGVAVRSGGEGVREAGLYLGGVEVGLGECEGVLEADCACLLAWLISSRRCGRFAGWTAEMVVASARRQKKPNQRQGSPRMSAAAAGMTPLR
jgi:hypothetical protein